MQAPKFDVSWHINKKAQCMGKGKWVLFVPAEEKQRTPGSPQNFPSLFLFAYLTAFFFILIKASLQR